MSSDRMAQAFDLFERALEHPPEERERFVATACGDDVSLRDRVMGMLRADAGAAPLLDGTPNELATALSTGPPPSLEGRRIGPYTITALLGRGGMGIVYLAKRDDVNKLVALKLVAGGLASPDRVARFVQERRVLAQFEHPHIARLLDAGVTDDGTPWFAMDYVPGKPIDVYCDDHSLTVDQRLALFERVCGAVAYAHRHLVVHRDLKPSNILVTADGEPRLVDFGIAKMLAESDEVIESLTASHSLPLTPQYASPEQIRGDAITTASDIYQLGALLFELLTGRAPHPERLGRFGTSADIAISRPSAIVHRESPPDAKAAKTPEEIAIARRMTPERLRRRLAGDLDTIVARATQLEPLRRYGTAEQLADDVRRHREGLPVLARPTSAAYRVSRFVRRHKAGTAVATGAMLALVGFSLAMAEQVRRVEAQRVQAEEVSTLLTDLFAGADPNVTQGETVTVATLLDRGAERVRAGLTRDPAVKARLLAVISRAYSNLGQLQRHVELEREAVDALRSAVPSDDPVLLEWIARLAGTLAGVGDTTRAKQLIQEATSGVHSLGSSRRFERAAVLASAAFVRHQSNDRRGARALYQDALGIFRTLPDTFGTYVEEPLVNFAYLEQTDGNLTSAEKLFREALERRRNRLGNEHSLTAKTALDLSVVLVRENKLDEAETLVREAVAVQKRVFSQPNTEVITGLGTLARLLGARGKYAEAESVQRQVIGTSREHWGDSTEAVVMGVANLAGFIQRQGRLEDAAMLHRDALKRYAALQGERHPSTAIVMTNLAYSAFLRRRFDESESLYRKAIVILDSAWQGTPTIAQTLTDFAVLLRERGNCAEGERHARRAFTLLRDAPEERLLYPQRVLGTCLVRLQRFAEAESLLVDAHSRLLKSRGPEFEYTKGVAQEVAQLYESWGKPDKAREYRVSAKSGS